MTEYYIYKPGHGFYSQYYDIGTAPFKQSVDHYQVTKFDSLEYVYTEFSTTDLETYEHLKNCVVLYRTEPNKLLKLYQSLKLEKIRWAMTHLFEIQANMAFNDVVHLSFMDLVKVERVIKYATDKGIKYLGVLDVTYFEDEFADATLEHMLSKSYTRTTNPLTTQSIHHIMMTVVDEYFPELVDYKGQMFGPYIAFKDKNDYMLFKLKCADQFKLAFLDFSEMPKKSDLTIIYSMLYSG